MNKEKQEQLIKFMNEHPGLQEKLNQLKKENTENINEKTIDELNAAGFEISMDDLKAPSEELSEDELKSVAGGGGCGCFLGGYGSGDYLECTCEGYGQGGVNGNGICEIGGCVCPVAGAGATNWEGYWEKISKESQGSK